MRGPDRWFSHQVDDSDDDAASSSFDLEAASASTPLKSGEASFFCSSPMKKLDNLHLQEEPQPPSIEDHVNIRRNDPKTSAEDTGAESPEEIGAADRTMEVSSSDSDNTNVFSEAPRFVRRRSALQKTVSSPKITPGQEKGAYLKPESINAGTSLTRKRQLESPDLVTPSHMSICTTSIPLTVSTSDSTPCPPQYRKRIKFKDEGTPSARPKLLNLLQLRLLADIDPNAQLNDDNDQHDDDNDDNDRMNSSSEHMMQTPISQSTPTSSRQPSPPTVLSFTEFGPAVNGYAFVGVAPKHNFYTYKTPTQTPSQKLKTNYIQNNYSIIGEAPVLSAGMMDESSAHIGDQRINDPYLEPRNAARDWYFEPSESIKYPLLSQFRGGSISTPAALEQCQQTSVVQEFYTTILEEGELLFTLLKRERVRWHPDKWTSLVPDELEVITALSLTLNSMVQELAHE